MKKFVEFVKNLHCDRYDKLISKIYDEHIPIAVFSSFNSDAETENGYKLLAHLMSNGYNVRKFLTPVDAVLENSSQYRNLEVESIKNFLNDSKGVKYIIVFKDPMANAFVEKFSERGISLLDYQTNIEPIQWDYNFYMKNLPRIFEVYKNLDEKSCKVFLAFILGNISGRIDDYIYDPMPQYFLDGFMPRTGDILIDGGAFDGSSGSMFKKFGCEVYSFELDTNNFPMAYERGKNEGFTVENLGLGEYSHKIKYTSASTGSSVDNVGNNTAEIISIDEYVREKNLPRIDFIKLDIEGSELDTLKGAALSIARWKPRLALSAYHKPEDIFTLYEFLKSIRSDYEFAFRHYATSFDNEPILFENQGREFLETFNLPLKAPYVWEAVLYAR